MIDQMEEILNINFSPIQFSTPPLLSRLGDRDSLSEATNALLCSFSVGCFFLFLALICPNPRHPCSDPLLPFCFLPERHFPLGKPGLLPLLSFAHLLSRILSLIKRA